MAALWGFVLGLALGIALTLGCVWLLLHIAAPGGKIDLRQ